MVMRRRMCGSCGHDRISQVFDTCRLPQASSAKDQGWRRKAGAESVDFGVGDGEDAWRRCWRCERQDLTLLLAVASDNGKVCTASCRSAESL